MELTQLKQFVAVAESGSLSQAAAQLYISQPALSTMLKKLEGELGVTLFDRTRNKITLNAAGAVALQHAQQLLAQAEAMKTALRDLARREQIYTVGFCDPGPMWFTVPQFALMHPALELRPQQYRPEEDAAALLRRGTYDLLMTAAPLADDDISEQPFIRDQLLLSVPQGNLTPLPAALSLRDAPIRELAVFQADGVFLRQNQPLFDAVAAHIRLHRFDDYFLFQQHLRDHATATINTRLVRHYRQDSGARDLIPLTDPEAIIDYRLAYLTENHTRLSPLRQWLTACAAGV